MDAMVHAAAAFKLIIIAFGVGALCGGALVSEIYGRREQ
jgi:hypothetical protein